VSPTQEKQRTPPGADADTPQEIPKKGWLQIVKRAWAEAKTDQVPLLAAGVAFFSFLSLFPALIAIVTLYGLVADPAQVQRQVDALSAALPEDAASLLGSTLEGIASDQGGALTLGLIISVALALWSASGGTGNLVSAVNTAYDEEETRGFVKRKLLSLALTLGAIVFVVVAIGLVAVFPAVVSFLNLPTGLLVVAQVLRWVVLVAAVAAALAIVYRYAPDRDSPKFAWVSVGAAVATVLWLIGSIGFSLYVNNFGSYNKTYGALAGVAVLLLWLWLTNYIILFGAEINAEAEQQTVKDTTQGPPQPLGSRDAVKADSLPSAADEKPVKR